MENHLDFGSDPNRSLDQECFLWFINKGNTEAPLGVTDCKNKDCNRIIFDILGVLKVSF